MRLLASRPFLLCALSSAAILHAPCLANQSDQQPVVDDEEEDDDEEDGEEIIFLLTAENAEALGVSNDDARPEDQFQTTLFGAPLTIGGEVEAAIESALNFDLDRSRPDRRVDALPETTIEALYQPATDVVFFAQAQALLVSEVAGADGPNRTQAGVSLDQAWLLWTRRSAVDFALQVGRQQFEDGREWWWSDELDAVRVHVAAGSVAGFVAVGEKLWSTSTLEPLEPDEKKLRRLLANFSITPNPRSRVDFYFLKQNDRTQGYSVGDLLGAQSFDETDANLLWTGGRLRTRFKLGAIGDLHLKFDGAYVDGEETVFEVEDAGGGDLEVTDAVQRAVSGWAIDAASSLRLSIPGKPVLSAGYAQGSGDRNTDDAIDRDFRQTGLHGNNDRFRGISRFEYYGEALRPELSNLRILTVAIGAPIGDSVWAEAVYHNYRQVAARDELRGSRLTVEPAGLSRRIGDEFDFVVSHESEEEHWEAELSAGAFRAGDAFGAAEGDWAFSVSAKLDYNF